jgi:hypothetical protein
MPVDHTVHTNATPITGVGSDHPLEGDYLGLFEAINAGRQSLAEDPKGGLRA